MSRKWSLVVAVTVVVLIGLLILGGLAIHRIGWVEGYRVGQLAVGGEGGTVVPYGPYGFGGPGLFLPVVLIILLLVVVGKFFRFWAWRMAGGPWAMAGWPRGGDWSHHWHGPRGPMPRGPVPPWCRGWEEPSEGKGEKAETDGESSSAEAES